jgi:hypothetical protein
MEADHVAAEGDGRPTTTAPVHEGSVPAPAHGTVQTVPSPAVPTQGTAHQKHRQPSGGHRSRQQPNHLSPTAARKEFVANKTLLARRNLNWMLCSVQLAESTMPFFTSALISASAAHAIQRSKQIGSTLSFYELT